MTNLDSSGIFLSTTKQIDQSKYVKISCCICVFQLVNKLSHGQEQGLYPFQEETDTETMNCTLKCSWDVTAETFEGLWENTKDFVSQGLVKEKRCRTSATQCLKHKWLKMCQAKLPNPKFISNPSYCYRSTWLRRSEKIFQCGDCCQQVKWIYNLSLILNSALTWVEKLLRSVVKCWFKILNNLAFC